MEFLAPIRWTRQPTYPVCVRPRWIDRGLHTLYLLGPNQPLRDLIRGTAVTFVGTGGTMTAIGWQTSGDTTNYLRLPLNVANAALPVSGIHITKHLSGSVDWSFLDSTSTIWSGFYSVAEGAITTTENNSFDGSLTPTLGVSTSPNSPCLVWGMSGANNLRGAANGGAVVIDSSCTAVTSGTKNRISLGLSDRSLQDNPSVSLHSLHGVFAGLLTDAELKALSEAPYGELLVPLRRVIYSISSTGSSIVTADIDSDATASLTWNGASLATSAFSSVAAASLTWNGASLATSAFSSVAAASLTWVGEASANTPAAFSSVAIASLTWNGASLATSSFSSVSAATLTWNGTSVATSAFNTPAAASLTWVGEAASNQVSGAVSIVATASATFAGASLNSAAFRSVAQANAIFVGRDANAAQVDNAYLTWGRDSEKRLQEDNNLAIIALIAALDRDMRYDLYG